MKILALIALVSLASCARAEWQENVGNGKLGQAQEPKDQTGKPVPVPAPTPTPGTQKFSGCESQTMNVTIDTSKTRAPLQDFKSVAAKYPLMHLTRAVKTKEQTVFFLNARDARGKSCADEACAELAGWSRIQDEVRTLNDVQISCQGDLPKLMDANASL